MSADSREERPGSPEESWDPGGHFTAKRAWLCDWEDRYHILGLLTYAGGEQYPYGDDEGGRDAYCSGTGCQPFGKLIDIDPESHLATYKKAIITAEYGTRKAGVLQPDPSHPHQLFSEMLEPTIEFITVDHRSFEWNLPYKLPDGTESTDLMPEQAPGVQLYGEIYTYTRHNLPEVPSALLSLYGSINEHDVVTKTFGITYTAETCILLPCPIDVTWVSIGGWPVKSVSVSLKMHYRGPASWNRYWRPDLGPIGDSAAWDYLKRRSDGQPFLAHRVANWSALWA